MVGRDWELGNQHLMGLGVTAEEMDVVVDELRLFKTLS